MNETQTMLDPITQAQDDSTELAEVHDRRIGRLEDIVEQLDRRLDSIEKRIDNVERAIGELFRRAG